MANELKIMEFLQRGYSNKYICSLLNITVDQVAEVRERFQKVYSDFYKF